MYTATRLYIQEGVKYNDAPRCYIYSVTILFTDRNLQKYIHRDPRLARKVIAYMSFQKLRSSCNPKAYPSKP